MPSTIRPDSGHRQHPDFDRVTLEWAKLRGLSPSAAKSDLRAIGLRWVRMVRFLSRLGAYNRIERWQVLASNAMRPTGALNCSDDVLRAEGVELQEAMQRAQMAGYLTALDGPLPIEEQNEARELLRLSAEVRQRLEVLMARDEARRA